MTADYIVSIFYIMWGLLVFTSICFLISGIDDLFFDIYFWIYFAWRYINVPKRHKLTYQELANYPQKNIAVMVPCWHEAGVIEEMLTYNVNVIDYQHYDIFVGVYPNDPHTVKAVQDIASIFPNVHCVINTDPGPTNKARNLNFVFSHILEYEKKHNKKIDIFVMHDSEDIIHANAFMLFNYLMPKNDMIQIPILPLAVSLRYFTHWTYNAEFCEIHTKDIIVREKIGGLVPSAGVGTAFSRKAMEILKEVRGGVPFSTYSLTEDYSTALEIRLQGLRQIFVLQHIYRTYWRKRWFFFGLLMPFKAKEYIATRGEFPMTYFKAVRQKTRWILGISFQEWIHTGWKGNLPTLYTLFHDRKSLFTHIVNGLFFLQVPFWTAYLYFTANIPDYPTLQDLFDAHPWVWIFIASSSLFMVNRFIQRAIAVYRVYGFLPALLSAPLILYGNIINLHALLRAYYTFLFSPQTKNTPVKWDKTDHTFPKHDLATLHKTKMGDLLLEQGLIDREQLISALSEQNQTGQQLGNVLLKRGYINKRQLTTLLAHQYHLQTIKKEKVIPMSDELLPKISKFNYDRLIHHKCFPIAFTDEHLLLAINDPANQVLLQQIVHWVKPYVARFILIESD